LTVVDAPSGSGPYAGTSPVVSPSAAGATATLVEGRTFAVSTRTGDIHSGFAQGLFAFDVRVLSRWELLVNGEPTESLAVQTDEPFAATFVSRAVPSPGHADATLVVFRTRHVGGGMREQIDITNHGLETATVALDVVSDADFAELFSVKEGRARASGRHSYEVAADALQFACADDRRSVRSSIHWSRPADRVSPGRASWSVEIPPGGTWSLCAEIRIGFDEVDEVPRFRCGGDDDVALPRTRQDEWEWRVPRITTDHPTLERTLATSLEDLGGLRIFDPDHPDDAIIAAGAPWFMAVFGRDSLIAAWMSLLVDERLAVGVLRTLARFQGREVNERSEEEPGKILHEMRFDGGVGLGRGDVYYGSIDATPLFVALLGELWRWHPDHPVIEEMLPHADRALEWIVRHGDRDGDGYVEYLGRTGGLANQGWKDSWDAIRHADGALATGPIALCEVQAYVYAAYRARARIAAWRGETATAARWHHAADELRRRFNEDFWLDEAGTFALALDSDKRPIAVVSSNPGHCLWAGIVEPERAKSVGERLLAPDSFSGFGIRTLAASARAYNPISYHNGSVWPHDNALCAAGLARYGMTGYAHRVIAAQLDVAEAFDGELPELLAGFDRARLAVPAPYPAACSPQAWAAAAPLLWLRTLLGLEPDVAERRLELSPSLLSDMTALRLQGVRIGGREVTIDVADGDIEVTGADGLELVI
jgi:glycogen debranching enzyme